MLFYLQATILTEGRTHLNVLIQNRSNDGQTMGLIALMLNAVNSKEYSTQAILVCETIIAAKHTFSQATKISTFMNEDIRIGLALFEEAVTPMCVSLHHWHTTIDGSINWRRLESFKADHFR